MRNGCTVAALISAMLNILNEISQTGVGAFSDATHMIIGVVLAIATLVAIWRIDVKRNNNHG
jgi:hypothetical protein